MQRAYNIECWSIAIDKAKEAIEQFSPNEIIVLDTCNSKYNTVMTLVAMAKAKLHRVVLLFVQANLSQCLQRDSKINESLLKDYVQRFKESLPKFKSNCDLFLTVRNNGTLEQLETELYDIWKKLCQNI